MGAPTAPGARAAALAAFAIAVLTGCGPEQGAPGPGAEEVLTGSVLYRERIALPADATVTVRLEDVSIADAPAAALAEQTIAANGRQVPIPFELRYPPERIQANGRYGVRAEIRAAGGELMFTTTSHHGVLEGGAAPERDIEVVVERVRADDGPTGSITGEPWRLAAIRRPGAAEEAVPPEPAYTIQFGADGRYSGQAHCNRYIGSYERPGPGELRMRGGAATLAACPPPSLADEYLRAVAAASRHAVSGDELRLTYGAGGELVFVREATRAAAPEVPWADAKRRGATFRALGNEPAWVLEIFSDRLVMVTNLGADRVELAHDGAVVDGARTTYRASADGRELAAVIERQPCADTMSGEAFEAAVTVTFGDETFRGCGRFL